MLRSHWDIEVYARDFQQSRWQEASRRRLADEAAFGASSAAVNPFNLAAARLVNAVSAVLGRRRAAAEPGPTPEFETSSATGVSLGSFQAKPARLAQPYADMVVLARGSAAGIAEQPSAVSDC